MSARRERQLIIESGSPLARHSLNQRRLKLSIEGERKLGIFPGRTESQLQKLLEGFGSYEFFGYLLGKAQNLDERGMSIPYRIGQMALGISSIINRELKGNPEGFLGDWSKVPRFKFSQGAPFAGFLPEHLMVNDYLLRTRQIPPKPQVVKQVARAARVYRYNVGGLVFAEGVEMTAICALVALGNISRLIGDELNKNRLSFENARKIIVAFGETTNRHLAKR